MDDYEHILAERLSFEPVVLLGYTDSELRFAIILAIAVGFPAGLILGIAIGKPMSGLGSGFLIALGIVYFSGKLLQRKKRGRPEFYYQTKVKLWLSRYGLAHCGLIRYSGRMNLGRTRYPRQ
jgi:conjugative transfer region protein (TIGR03750 family)